MFFAEKCQCEMNTTRSMGEVTVTLPRMTLILTAVAALMTILHFAFRFVRAMAKRCRRGD